MKITVLIAVVLSIIFLSCKEKTSTPDNSQSTTTGTTTGGNTPNSTIGYGVLSKVKGIWNGPVNSTTALGNFPEWIVDFRPISENQISSKNELDTLNDIHMSFFITKYNNQTRVAFRNGGSFAGMHRVSYFLADSVLETATRSYYRFSEIIKGKSRAYTEVITKNDSLIIKSYTNIYNIQSTATPHMAWYAKLQDSTACQPAVTNFGFPKNTICQDFSSTFIGQSETIYYNSPSDPYPESAQPYLGKTTVTYNHAGTYTANATHKVFLLLSTQPLLNGATLNLKNRSRSVILAANDLSYTFNYMHPGTYYAYAMYDNDGNGIINSGDWFSLANTPFTLVNQGVTSVNVSVNFQVP